MQVNREDLLSALIAVAPGLAAREFIEQSTCYVFGGGLVQTFNDEIACTYPCGLDVSGAVSAAPLQTLLGKLGEETLEVEAVEGRLEIKAGKRKRAQIRMEAEITLPLDHVEQPKKWHPLHADFAEAVNLIHTSASKRDSNFCLTCVHIAPEWVEACDNLQAARWPLATGVKKSTLVKRDTIRTIVQLEMNELAETKSWLHFRNPAGLILSCRRHFDEYPPLDNLLAQRGSGQVFTLPGGLAEVLEKAEVFSGESDANNRVMVRLKPGRMMVRGEGVHGLYEESKKAAYDGPPMEFLIGPQYLNEIAKMNNQCEIVEGRLALDTGKFQYVTCTAPLGGVADTGGGDASDADAPPPKAKKKKRETVPADDDGDVPF